MKINLTKKQYRLLMERCYIADWIINAYREKFSEAGDQQEDLQQYLFSFAKDFDYLDNITYLPEADANIWADDYLDKNPVVEEFMQFYDSNRFADMLSDRLAVMALEEKYSEEELEAMEEGELAKQFRKLKSQALASSSLLQAPETEDDGQ